MRTEFITPEILACLHFAKDALKAAQAMYDAASDEDKEQHDKHYQTCEVQDSLGLIEFIYVTFDLHSRPDERRFDEMTLDLQGIETMQEFGSFSDDGDIVGSGVTNLLGVETANTLIRWARNHVSNAEEAAWTAWENDDDAKSPRETGLEGLLSVMQYLFGSIEGVSLHSKKSQQRELGRRVRDLTGLTVMAASEREYISKYYADDESDSEDDYDAEQEMRQQIRARLRAKNNNHPLQEKLVQYLEHSVRIGKEWVAKRGHSDDHDASNCDCSFCLNAASLIHVVEGQTQLMKSSLGLFGRDLEEAVDAMVIGVKKAKDGEQTEKPADEETLVGAETMITADRSGNRINRASTAIYFARQAIASTSQDSGLAGCLAFLWDVLPRFEDLGKIDVGSLDPNRVAATLLNWAESLIDAEFMATADRHGTKIEGLLALLGAVRRMPNVEELPFGDCKRLRRIILDATEIDVAPDGEGAEYDGTWPVAKADEATLVA